jgi:hypothetical protein
MSRWAVRRLAGSADRRLEAPMRYLLLIYGDRDYYERVEQSELDSMMDEYWAFTRSINESGEFVNGEALQPAETATTVRVRNDETLTTDGPFAETKEILGGYYLVDCKDLDRAIELAARIPDVRNGSIEIRPVMELTPPGDG